MALSALYLAGNLL